MKKSSVTIWLGCMLLWAGCGGKPDDTSSTPDTNKPGENKPSGPITITGRVWKAPGVPDTQALVLIPGKDRKPVVVDAQGAFTIPDITPPYDLAVRMKDSPGVLARVYKGLTRKDPEVFALTNPDAEKRSNTLKGKVTGRQAAPETSTVFVKHLLPTIPGVWFFSHLGGGSVTDASGAFSFESDWGKDSNDVGALVALEYTKDNGQPRRYLAYGRRDGVGFQSTSSETDIAMSPVKSSTLSVELTGVAPRSNNMLSLQMSPAPGLLLDLDAPTQDSNTFSLNVPEVPEATFLIGGSLYGNDRDSWMRAGLKAGDSLKVVPPVIVKPIVPASGDENVSPTATFSHSQVPNALYTHVFVCGTYQVILDQMSPQVTLPDVKELGFTLKSGERCQWTVYAVSPVPSVDEMAGFNYPKLRELAQKDVVFVSLSGVYFNLAK